MNNLLKDLVGIISQKLDFRDQLSLKRTCKHYYSAVHITILPDHLFKSFNDDIIMQYPYLRSLDTRSDDARALSNFIGCSIWKCKITTKSILTLKYLTKLDAFWNPHITNECLINLKLLTWLDAGGSISKITDSGICHLQLKHLGAGYNTQITDAGIAHMQLDSLTADNNPNITDSGIMHMNLTRLSCLSTSSITDRGIMHMKLEYLLAYHNPNVTRKEIKK